MPPDQPAGPFEKRGLIDHRPNPIGPYRRRRRFRATLSAFGRITGHGEIRFVRPHDRGVSLEFGLEQRREQTDDRSVQILQSLRAKAAQMRVETPPRRAPARKMHEQAGLPAPRLEQGCTARI
jgi:hypothetical protein